MSRLKQWLKMGLLNQGGAAGLALPYSFDPAALADGALPAPWTGATFAVASGKVTNTPGTGAEDITNGSMEAGDPPVGWTAASATLDSAADERTGGAGAASLSVANSGAAYGSAYQNLDTANAWILVDAWMKRVTATNAGLYVRNTADTVTLAYSVTTSVDWVRATLTSPLTSGNWRIKLADSNTNNGVHQYDDISVKPLTTAQLFGVVDAGVSDVTAGVIINTTPGAKHAGLLLNLDSAANPQNYVVAYLTTAEVGAMQARLTKCVNGVLTVVIAGDATYGATKNLKVVKSGDNYSLYYGLPGGETQVGTTQVIAGMNGTRHGLFSTGGGTFGAFSLGATPPNP